MSTRPNQSPSAEALAERLFRDLLGTFTIASTAIGSQLGLYAAMRDGAPLNASELASRADIAERYAREWLESQAADGILTLEADDADPDARRFALPAEHADVLANPDHLDYMAPFANLVTAGIVQLPGLMDAYRTGAGVPWSAYGEAMRRAQGDANRPLFMQQLGQQFLPALPDVHELLSRPDGARVAEIGSGMGWAAIGIARAYPQVRVDGFDPDQPSVASATANAEAYGVGDRVTFSAINAAEAGGQYDVVTALECLHDMPDPVSVLRAMREMLAPGGVCLVMDERAAEQFAAPAEDVDRLLYGYSLLVCLPDGLSHQPSVGTGTVMRPGILRDYARQAGFSDVESLDLEHPFFRFYRLR